jgi:kinesin family protein 5
MEGPSLWDANAQGVIPRTVEKLFSAILEADSSIQFTVSVSYFEVYCEKIRDLLNPQQDNMKIRETKADGCTIQDITEVFCTNREGVITAIETGKTYRACAPTLMNAESSRSHSILSIVVNQKSQTTGRHKKGKMYLVDLAGSEKVSKTGATGARLEEAKNINRSLTTLGMVINSLCDGNSHIPYRDSKLTRILQDSLGV